ncbi:MAG: hypothetical protein LBK92_01905, partial [Endomicrobium sp.]|nr:hypothetical protein [Endomicrobium sp.]
MSKSEEERNEATAKAQSLLANASNATEIAKYNAQVAIAQAEVDKQALAKRPRVGTSKWIQQTIDIIRLLFGIIAICVFVMASLHYFFPTEFGNVLEYVDFSNAFFVVLGFFFGERCV